MGRRSILLVVADALVPVRILVEEIVKEAVEEVALALAKGTADNIHERRFLERGGLLSYYIAIYGGRKLWKIEE